MNNKFTENEINALMVIVGKANKKDRTVGLLQPIDLGFNSNTKEGRRSFKKLLGSLNQKDYFDKLHFQDTCKCIVDEIKIKDDIFEIITEINEEELNG